MKIYQDTDHFLSEKRAWKALRRRQKKARKNYNKGDGTLKYRSPIISLFHSACDESFKPGIKKEMTVSLPSCYSVIENPVEFLQRICVLGRLNQNQRLRQLVFDHSVVAEIDLAAEAVLDCIAIEMKKERSHKRKKLKVSGYYPKDERLKKYIRAIGIIKSLEVKHEYLPKYQEDELNIFKAKNAISVEKITAGASSYKERAVKKFVDHINACLNEHDKEMTAEGKHMLVQYTGEVLDNAIEHSDMHHWEITGFLDNSIEPYLCDIAIFNFGKTIFESFKDLGTFSYPYQKQIFPILSVHQNKKTFSNRFSKENLITLLALQETISSKNTSNESTRGTGTVQLINFFEKIHLECTQNGTSCAKMAILSGKTHIYFDGTYKMKPDQYGRSTIAFNASNDLHEKPDSKYVHTLGDFSFPGTIISIQFPMQKGYTKEV